MKVAKPLYSSQLRFLVIFVIYIQISFNIQCLGFTFHCSTSSRFLRTSFSSAASPARKFMTFMAATEVKDGDNPLERFGLPQPLLLGSASYTRKLILGEMGVPFSKLVRPIDEKALGDRTENAPPHDLVLLLGTAKMDHLISEIKAGNCKDDLPVTNEKNEYVVLTGDQVVTCNGQILEKPESVEEAKEFVTKYKTSPPSTVGSVVITHLPSGIQVSGVDTATIHFRSTLPADQLVDQLLEQGEPILSCAGGLMVEHPLVKEHIERIDGTEDSVMGLSKDLVLKLLEEISIAVKEQEGS